MEEPVYLTSVELSMRLRISQGTLANWRMRGEGPKFAKIGKKVLYPMSEIVRFEAEALRQSNAAATAGATNARPAP